MNGRLLPYIEELQATIGERADPIIPKRWTRKDRPYVALLDPPLWNGPPARIFISRIDWSSTGKTGQIELTTPLEHMPEGALIEVCYRQRKRGFRGGRRQRKQEIYRKDPEGWRLLAYRYLDAPVGRGARRANPDPLSWRFAGG
jgi:hypothetical protein